jgi:hypothetical protein
VIALAKSVSAKANMRLPHVKARVSYSREAHGARAGRSQNRLHTQKALIEFLLVGRVEQ